MKLNIYDEMNNFNQSNLVVKLNLDSENNLIDQIRYTTHIFKRDETDSDIGDSVVSTEEESDIIHDLSWENDIHHFISKSVEN